jgi:uncharacterized protein (DUF2141 family)
VLIGSASLMTTASVPASPAAQKQGSAISTVWVTDTRSTEGKIGIALSRTGGFPEDVSETLCAQDVQIGALRAQMVFRDTPSEIYAVSVRHGENSNGKPDTDLSALLEEGCGVSNNPIKHRTRSLDEAKISVPRTEQVMEIKLIY